MNNPTPPPENLISSAQTDTKPKEFVGNELHNRPMGASDGSGRFDRRDYKCGQMQVIPQNNNVCRSFVGYFLWDDRAEQDKEVTLADAYMRITGKAFKPDDAVYRYQFKEEPSLFQTLFGTRARVKYAYIMPNGLSVCPEPGTEGGMIWVPLGMDAFQFDSARTAIYPGVGTDAGKVYATLGMTGECGEYAGKIKKLVRGDKQAQGTQAKEARLDELGDVLWYVAMAAAEEGVSLEWLAIRNRQKLADRQGRGTLQGEGDKR